MLSPENYWPDEVTAKLRRQHYALFGHSAVKLCHYTKSSLTGNKACYKQKFYGINSHRCLQMTPLTTYCGQKCIFCWRPHIPLKEKIEPKGDPKEIAELSIEMQRKLLSGYGALKEQIGEKKLLEANSPNNVAISLSGEPTFYPFLSELIDEYKKRNFSTFLVSNGLNPEALENISLPTQLYLSLEAVDEATHKRLNAPIIKGSWEKFNRSLELMPSLSTRKVIRVTAIGKMNMEKEKQFAELIQKAGPDFVEVKGYVWVGESRKRLKEENMPFHSSVKDFAVKINNHLNYTLLDESPGSRVVLLSSGKKKPLTE